MTGRPLRVAFAGNRRAVSSMPPGYWPMFIKCHVDHAWHFATHAPIDVTFTTPEPVDYDFNAHSPDALGSLSVITEEEFVDCGFEPGEDNGYDVVVHWRKWFPSFHVPGARNIIVSQDHSYSPEWVRDVKQAYQSGELDGILTFPTWHTDNTFQELGRVVPYDRLYSGLTFGVDTDVYRPEAKDPYSLLWAADPGRGLHALINPFLRLWNKDRRFRLTVCYPDYVKPELVSHFSSFLKHPGVNHRGFIANGPELWNLFNSAGVVPYSSTFPEPSSRCHRQGQAAGCLVLYPPNMGTPSKLIENGLTGIVEDVSLWPEIIAEAVKVDQNGHCRRDAIGANARVFALSENWAVQAKRFHSFFSRGLS